MGETMEDIVQKLKDAKPPASDPFTYLVLIETYLSPDILPTLAEILDDAQLTNDIGWDLVDMLISTPGSAECLERVARLGNPREVILKVLEVMDKTSAAAEKEHEHEQEQEQEEGTGETTKTQPRSKASVAEEFIVLVGMLKILHGRLQVKAPSRFLHTTLDTVLRAYNPTHAESTAAVIDLARSLSGQKRPPLPSRQSSTVVNTLFQRIDPSQAPPDPEADSSDVPNPLEPQIMNRLLQSFITCVIEAYVNSNSLEWASRLLEYTYPERIVPRRKTMLQAFNEIDELKAMDALVGQLAAVASDLGLTKISEEESRRIFTSEPSRDPLSDDTDPEHPENIHLSTAGFACLTAYWMFSTDIFDAPNDHVNINIFPEHYQILKNLTGENAEVEIMGNAGTFESLIVIALWLHTHRGVLPASPEVEAAFMAYHHQLTLISVFHPNIRVRNAATNVAGSILHSDPDEGSRLATLEDLLENCVFSSLQACGVTWFREELLAARKSGSDGIFAKSDCFEKLQYTMFPDLTSLQDADTEELWNFWTENAQFHLAVANFALFLYGGKDFKDLPPSGMAAAIEHRYAAPLIKVAEKLSQSLESKQDGGASAPMGAELQLGVVIDTLKSAALH